MRSCAPPIGEALQNLMWGGGVGLSQYIGGAWGGLKMLSKNTCEGVQFQWGFCFSDGGRALFLSGEAPHGGHQFC